MGTLLVIVHVIAESSACLQVTDSAWQAQFGALCRQTLVAAAKVARSWDCEMAQGTCIQGALIAKRIVVEMECRLVAHAHMQCHIRAIECVHHRLICIHALLGSFDTCCTHESRSHCI